MINNVASWNDLALNRDWKSTYLPTWRSMRLSFLTKPKKSMIYTYLYVPMLWCCPSVEWTIKFMMSKIAPWKVAWIKINCMKCQIRLTPIFIITALHHRTGLDWAWLVKFIYSEKATNFCEIFTLLLSYVVPVKSKVKISQNF